MKKTLLQFLLLSSLVLGGWSAYAQNTCLQDWRYSRPVSIRNFTFGLLNDWQVKVTINTQALIGAGKMNADGSDIRFTADDCCTQLPYWIQSGINTPTTVIWTRVPQLASLDTTWITMYYGNSAATTPISNLDLVHFTLGNDSMGTDTATPGITCATQEYPFPIAARTVRWRIYSDDTMRIKFKVSNDTNMVTGSSPFFNVPSTPGFYTFDHELVSIAGGHPGWYTSTGGRFLNTCAPVQPCPGSCGHVVYRTLDQGVFGALKTDTCGVLPNMRVWYRRSAFVDPASNVTWAEFDRQQPFTLQSPGGNQMCVNDSLMLYTDSLPGAVSYQWFHNGVPISGANDTSVVAHFDGYYHCVADFGMLCETISSDTVTISYPTTLLNLGADIFACTDGSVTVTAPSTYAAYLWSDNSTGTSLVVSSSGTYWLEVTDTVGCTDQDSIAITLKSPPDPAITIQGTMPICVGDTVNLVAVDTSYYAYQWLPGGETSGNLIVTDSGTFSVIVWDRDFCSDTSASVTVQVFPQPMVDIGPDWDLCDGDTVTLDAGAGWASILWPDGSPAQTFDATFSGNFVVQVVDSNGCEDKDSALVTFHHPPDINLGPSQVVCAGTTIALDAGPGQVSYAWSNGATTQSVTVGYGVYNVFVIDSNGCSSTSNLVYVTYHPQLGDVTIVGDLTGLFATTAPNYQWYQNGSAIGGATDSSFTPDAAGTYYVEVIDPYGCQNEISNSIEIILDTIAVITQEDVPQGFSPNGDGINDRFEVIGITDYPQSSLVLMNRWGSQVYAKAPYDNSFNGLSDQGKELPDGTYFYVLKLGDGTEFSDYLIINR